MKQMSNRERIVNTGLCKETDRAPFFFYFGPWAETMERWQRECPGVTWDNWRQGYGFDEGIDALNVNLGYFPEFEYKLIEDKGTTRIVQTSQGIIQEEMAHSSTIPRYLSSPVKNADDWEKLKKRLDPNDPARFPPDWPKQAETLNKADKAVQIGNYPWGLFGTLRDMMGVEDLLVNFYDQPELIHNMMDYLTDFWLAIYEKAAKNVKIDIIHIWEDMSGCSGSLISPRMIRDFMMPNYKKIRKFADDHSIPLMSLDTDGDCTQLVPLFLESGFNLLLPFEAAAGSDILDYRKKYPKLAIMGGIDKREIALGKEHTDRELDRIKDMFKYPGYFPALDHLIHPEISHDDFEYFVAKLKEIIGISV